MEEICDWLVKKRKANEKNDSPLEKILILPCEILYKELDEECRYRRKKRDFEERRSETSRFIILIWTVMQGLHICSWKVIRGIGWSEIIVGKT